MRLTSIITWSPDDTATVFKSFEEFGKGNLHDNGAVNKITAPPFLGK